MAAIRPVITDFSAGELSPSLAGRVDLGIYYKGAKELYNMLPRPLGGVYKRPGTEFIGNTLSDAEARLIPFTVSPSLSFIIELTPLKLRLWSNDALVLDDSTGAAVSLTTEFTAGELFEIDYSQTYREIVLVHPNREPFRFRYISTVSANRITLEHGTPSYTFNALSFDRDGTESWTCDELIDEIGQWIPYNISKTAGGTCDGQTALTITNTGDSVVITRASGGTKTYARGTSYTDVMAITASAVPFASENNYPGVICHFADRLRMGSTINEPRTMYSSRVRNMQAFEQYETVEYKKTEETDAGTRVNCTCTTTQSSELLTLVSPDPGAGIEGRQASGDNIPYGAKVLTSSGGTVVLDMPALSTKSPSSVYFSNWKDADIPEYTEVTETTQQIGDANGFRIALATEEDETIMWAAGTKDIYIGTASSEWVIAGGSSARTAEAQMVSRFGSAKVKARMVGGSLYFVQSGGKAVRVFGGPSISEHADHILSPGIVQLEFQQSPELCLYAVLADGTMARCSLTSETPAWSLIATRTGDSIESVAVIPGSGRDYVYLTVLRGSLRFIERLVQNDDLTFAGRKYLDCSTYWTGTASASITGLERFSGMSVRVRYVAGGVEKTADFYVTETGAITLAEAATKWLAGLAYTARVETYRLESPQGSEGIIKSIASVFLRLFRCGPYSIRYRPGQTTTETAPTGISGIPVNPGTGLSIYPYTGPVEHTIASPWGPDQSIIIESTEPVPLGIQTVAPGTELGG